MHQNYAIKIQVTMLVYEETAIDRHREVSLIEKKPPFCLLCMRTDRA